MEFSQILLVDKLLAIRFNSGEFEIENIKTKLKATNKVTLQEIYQGEFLKKVPKKLQLEMTNRLATNWSD